MMNENFKTKLYVMLNQRILLGYTIPFSSLYHLFNRYLLIRCITLQNGAILYYICANDNDILVRKTFASTETSEQRSRTSKELIKNSN